MPNFDIWFKDMMGDGQTADNGSGDSIHDGEGDGHGHAHKNMQEHRELEYMLKEVKLWGKVREGGGWKAKEELSNIL
jgi:hypothetical protein